MKALEKIYFGELRPNELGGESGERYHKMERVSQEREDYLMQALEGKDKNCFLDYTNCQAEILGALTYESFSKGFRLGMQMVLENLWDE